MHSYSSDFGPKTVFFLSQEFGYAHRKIIIIEKYANNERELCNFIIFFKTILYSSILFMGVNLTKKRTKFGSLFSDDILF